MGAVTYPTLEHVAMEARPYPAERLQDCETGLCLFAAAFLGHNDAVHFAEAGVRTTCVDVDGNRLEMMKELYPSSWEWMVDDAWKFSDAAYVLGEQWDAVSADPFTGDAMTRSLASLGLWCSLARRLVVVGFQSTKPWPELDDSVSIPEGWAFSFYPRSGNIYWLVLIRA